MAANLTAALVKLLDPTSGNSEHVSNGTSTALMAMDLAVTSKPAPPPPLPEYYQNTKFICEQVLLPLVCSLGIIGNGLSLCVLTRREMAAATTCFLTALAVSDILLLSLQLPLFLGHNEAIAARDSYKIFNRYYYVIR